MFNFILDGLLKGSNVLSGVFNQIADSILAMIPSLQDNISYVVTFLNTILKFVPLCLDFLMIPRACLVALFDYYLLKYGIYLFIRGFKFALNVYNKIKI